MKTMRRVGSELVQEHKKLYEEKIGLDGTSGNQLHKDLLSVLVKANMDPDIPESQRMNDEDVLARKHCSRARWNVTLICYTFRNTDLLDCGS